MKYKINLVILMCLFLILGSSTVVANELTIWQSDSQEAEWMREMGEKYEAKTGVTINVETVSEEEQAEILSVKGPKGDGADIVGYAHDHLGVSVEEGLLLPIEDYLSEEYIRNNYSEIAVNALTYNEKIYGIPYSYETMALVYNKDLITEIPENFEELKEKAHQLTDHNKNEFGFLYNFNSLYRSYAFIAGFGGYVFGEENGVYDLSDIGLDNQGSIKGVNYIKDMVEEELMLLEVDADELFKAGQVAMTLAGPWAIPEYKNAGIDIGVKPIPKLPNNKYPKTFVGVAGYYITSYSNYEEESAEFIKWLTDTKRAKKRLENLSQVIPQKEFLTSSELDDENIRGFITQAERGEIMPNIPEIKLVWVPAANGIEFVISDEAPADQVMPIVVKQIKESIQ